MVSEGMALVISVRDGWGLSIFWILVKSSENGVSKSLVNGCSELWPTGFIK